MKRLVPLFLLALLAIPAYAAPTQIINSIGRLDNGCTVFAVADERYVTAAHCVLNMETGEVDLTHDYTVDGKTAFLQYVDLDHDLAAFLVPFSHKEPLKLADRSPRTGDYIAVVGHALGLQSWMFMQGFVANPSWSDPDEKRLGWDKAMIYDMSGCGGHSGSPVVNKKGELVSVLQFGWGNGCGSPVGGATYSELKAFLTKLFTL